MLRRLLRLAARSAVLAGRVVEYGAVAESAYLAVLTSAAVRRTSRPGGRVVSEGTTSRFAILVPAHDEAQLIASTVSSLLALRPPAGGFEVHVVADNCTDGTAELARDAGAFVHERVDSEVPGKGPALMWLVGRIQETRPVFDAYVVIDADTTADPLFLIEIDKALAAGAEVVQGSYGVRGVDASPSVAFRAAALAVRNHLRPLGRTAIGGTAGLYGNGMGFRSHMIEGQSWSAHLTEDVETSLRLLDQGTLVAFAPNARVHAEMPTSLSASATQHQRWEQGRLDLTRRFVPHLLRRVVTGGRAPRIAYVDAVADQLVPPLSVLVAVTAAWCGLACGRMTISPSRAARRDLGRSVASLLAQAVTVGTALRLVDAPRSVYRSLWRTPTMVLWKVKLWLRSVTGRDRVDWMRTARNAEDRAD